MIKSLKYSLLIVLLILVLFESCEKVSSDDLSNKIVFSDMLVTSFINSVNIVTDFPEAYEVGIDEFGICWSDNLMPEISDEKLVFTEDTIGNFIVNLNGLKPEKTYYARAYCVIGEHVIYDNELFFKTLDSRVPVIKLNEITNLRANYIELTSELVSSNGSEIFSRGLCWSAKGAPNLSDNYLIDYSLIDVCSNKVEGLEIDTEYYIRAFAENDIGIAYSKPYFFITLNGIVHISTSQILSDSPTQVTIIGRLYDDGGLDIISYGACWNLEGQPTLSDSVAYSPGIPIGEDFNSFYSDAENLEINTPYHFRAFIINGNGVVYGDELIRTEF